MSRFSVQPVWLFIASNALAVCLWGCSRPIHSAAVGKWRAAGNDAQNMEFRSDGTFQGTDRYGRALTGNFSFTDAEHVQLETTMISEDKAKGLRFVDHSSGVVRLVVTDNEMLLTEPGGPTMRYQRQR